MYFQGCVCPNICSQYLDSQFLLSLNILSFWTYDVTNILKTRGIMPLSIFIVCRMDFDKTRWSCSLNSDQSCTQSSARGRWEPGVGGGGLFHMK